MADYADVSDIIAMKRPLTADEADRASYLIPIVCDSMRYEAEKVGKDLDAMIAESTVLAAVAKAVTIDVVMRELNTPGTQLPATSYSEAAGGVSQSYSLPNASGRIALWPSDLKALGLRRQKIDAIPLWKGVVECCPHS